METIQPEQRHAYRTLFWQQERGSPLLQDQLKQRRPIKLLGLGAFLQERYSFNTMPRYI